jgi:hypothetical protein
MCCYVRRVCCVRTVFVLRGVFALCRGSVMRLSCGRCRVVVDALCRVLMGCVVRFFLLCAELAIRG